MLRGRPELALQRLLGSHASRSTRVSASTLTRVPCFAVDPSWRFSAYSGPMLRGRPELAHQRLLGPTHRVVDPSWRFSAYSGPMLRGRPELALYSYLTTHSVVG